MDIAVSLLIVSFNHNERFTVLSKIVPIDML